jgi:N-acyl homoserine lactone hydrolase
VDLPAGRPVWVHADELAAAEAAGARFGYHPAVLAAPVAWRTFRGDVSPFAGVRLLETPGHSRGHVSVLVEMDEARLLVTGDAAPTVRSLAERVLPGLHVDAVAAAASLDRLIGLWRAGAVPLPSHDPAFWEERRLLRFERSSATPPVG